ncbi:MAG TPA: hypothetical protein VHZ26_01140 [Caulobacteraceae bacterium]|jgi:hypothetical protein|nr:hypothetical protein [Caulobacteraceae bacterium]
MTPATSTPRPRKRFRPRPRAWAAALAGAVLALAPGGGPRAAEPSGDPGGLRYGVDDGPYLNRFVRQGPVAAHLVLRSGRDPRILVAFPAGDSGVGLWFGHRGAPMAWSLTAPPTPISLADAKGRPLHGVSFALEARADALRPVRALLSSVRVLRDYPDLHGLPPALLIDPAARSDTLTWARDRLDGAPGYRLAVQVIHGSLRDGRMVAAADGRIGLRIQALSGEAPLTPLGGADLMNSAAASDPAARNALSFLSYREKFLAGSWRFDTYFGRDTLMTLELLTPVLQPAAVEDGLGAVVSRLAPDGEVAHEESIGEFAILAHLKAGQPPSDAPVFDYGMIDSSYMLAPVAADWLVDDPRGRGRAAAYLAAPDGRAGNPSERVGAALVRNFRFVVAQTRPFASQPRVDRLLALKPGHVAGQWRDSPNGLGGGRYPYDVNLVFAPAALSAIGRIEAAGLLAPYETAGDRTAFRAAERTAAVWRARAPGYFTVRIGAAAARRMVAAYARDQGVPASPALAALGQAALAFPALALDAGGAPIPILHSDEGFDLLFGRPDARGLSQEVEAMMRPFPAGLMTDVGLLVADPVFASPTKRAAFTRGDYHGEVVWSWQQAVLAAGLERQLRRTDLPPAVRARLRAAQARLWSAIEATRPAANSELWSWTWSGGRYRTAPFGAGKAGSEEADAAQLWSTVYLAVRPPPRAASRP